MSLASVQLRCNKYTCLVECEHKWCSIECYSFFCFFVLSRLTYLFNNLLDIQLCWPLVCACTYKSRIACSTERKMPSNNKRRQNLNMYHTLCWCSRFYASAQKLKREAIHTHTHKHMRNKQRNAKCHRNSDILFEMRKMCNNFMTIEKTKISVCWQFCLNFIERYKQQQKVNIQNCKLAKKMLF